MFYFIFAAIMIMVQMSHSNQFQAVLSGRATWDIDVGATTTTITLTITEDLANRWYAIGFDSSIMTGTMIIVYEPTSPGAISERTLADHARGTVVSSPEWTMDSEDTADSANIVVVFSRANTPISGYTFTTSTTLQAIFATGPVSGGLIQSHNGGSPIGTRLPATLSEITTPNPTATTSTPTWATTDPTDSPIIGTASPSSSPSNVPSSSPNAITCATTVSVTVGPFVITLTIDCDNDKAILNVIYDTWNGNNWFGFVLADSMSGDALLYTTGKSDDRTAGIYGYDITSRSLGSIDYDSSQVWTEISTDTSTGIDITYEADLVNTPWTVDTETVTLRYAIGPDTGIAFEGKHVDTGSTTILNFVGGSTTELPVSTGGDDQGEDCGGNAELIATASIDDFEVNTIINCDDETVQIEIIRSNYNAGWFGMVFNDAMSGQAVVYTSGHNDDRAIALYAYDIGGKSVSGVAYNSEDDWELISEDNTEDTIHIIYKQDLSKTPFTTTTTSMNARFAFGDNEALAYHSTSKTDTLDLLTGVVTEQDISAQIAHGVIMWIAWSILASIGIFGSAHRWLFDGKSKGFWFFKIHRPIQMCVCLLCVIGFIIAIVFTSDSGTAHFYSNHMRCGLVVTILCILQPINAFFRPHVPKPGEDKSTIRLMWEIAHKVSGYVAWILALITIYLGFRTAVINAKTLSIVHLVWFILVLILYAILFVMGRMRKKLDTEITETKAMGSTSNLEDAEAQDLND